MNKVYTIAEVAVMLKVTKQCIYKKLNTLPNLNENIITKKNKKYINIRGIEILVENLGIENFKVEDLKLLNENKNCLKNDSTDLYSVLMDLNKNYEEQINKITVMYENQIEHLKKESLDKTELIKNMQVLLKDHQLLLNSKHNKKWWKFWKN